MKLCQSRTKICVFAGMMTFAAILLLTAAVGLSQNEYIELPILMYHHIDTVGDSNVTISDELFQKQLDYLVENGYQTVTFDELTAYTNGDNVELPEKPVAIVFDDGYESNYIFAYPALKERGLNATICVIGSCVGKNTYKDTGVPMPQYLSGEQMREMSDSGVIAIGSHTYDMHQYKPLEVGIARESVTKLPGESDAEFIKNIREDYTINSDLIYACTGKETKIFAYPNGKYSLLSEKIIRSLGAKVTLTTTVGMNTVIKDNPESLYLLKRFNINQTTDIETLQCYLDGYLPK